MLTMIARRCWTFQQTTRQKLPHSFHSPRSPLPIPWTSTLLSAPSSVHHLLRGYQFSVELYSFHALTFVVVLFVRTEKVQKRASNVLKLAEENEKLKEELRAMSERLEAAERRRAELDMKRRAQQQRPPGAA